MHKECELHLENGAVILECPKGLEHHCKESALNHGLETGHSGDVPCLATVGSRCKLVANQYERGWSIGISSATEKAFNSIVLKNYG